MRDVRPPPVGVEGVHQGVHLLAGHHSAPLLDLAGFVPGSAPRLRCPRPRRGVLRRGAARICGPPRRRGVALGRAGRWHPVWCRDRARALGRGTHPQRADRTRRPRPTTSWKGVFEATSGRLRRLVPFDASVWLALDPATTLPTAPTRSEQLGHVCSGDAQSCLRVWELEFLVEDVNLYRDLARAQCLHRVACEPSTDDRPARSASVPGDHRARGGFDDELRAVMRVYGRPGSSIGALPGTRAVRPSTPAEADLLAGLSGPVAAAVRDHSRPATCPFERPNVDTRGPGLLLFDASGELISINDDALAWLDELAPSPNPDKPTPSASCLPRSSPSERSCRARAIAEERDHVDTHGPGCAPARPAAGSCSTPPACARPCGEIGDTALIIEPANACGDRADRRRRPTSSLAREQQITELDRPRGPHGRESPIRLLPLGAHRPRLRQGRLRRGLRLEPG